MATRHVGADVLRRPDGHRGVSKDRPESFDPATGGAQDK